MRNLYIECYSGISGDMVVGALLDLGADKEALIKGLNSLNIDGFNIKITNVVKGDLEVCDYNVIIEDDEDKKTDFKIKRNYNDISKIIDNSCISKHAKDLSKRIFNIKAKAGSIVHNIPFEEFYFHESGAIDSLADIIGAAICLDNLSIDKVFVSEIFEGHGFINFKNGVLPVPVPAVTYITKEFGLELTIIDVEGEMVTPTGAAILAGLSAHKKLPADYRVIKVGLGNGKRNYSLEGILRMYLIE